MFAALFSRFTFLKPIVMLVIFAVCAYCALKLFKLIDEFSTDYKQRGEQISLLNTSISNIQSDKTELENALLSERILREDLQAKILLNSQLILEYSAALNEQRIESKKKVKLVQEIAKESTNESCINADMPDDIISLFNNKDSSETDRENSSN